VLIATYAAGERINLQRSHLMVDYNLPWNPNRIEQRFGRIHRIGQTKIWHLWNLVAVEAREGDVYHALLEKLEQARQALGGHLGTATCGAGRPRSPACWAPCQMTGQSLPKQAQTADTQASAARARAIVLQVERQLGFQPTDREYEKLGYDIESPEPRTGRLRFLEVKGRVSGAATITVTKNEVLYSLNRPEGFILAIVEFLDGEAHNVHYVRRPFQREPDFGVTSVNYDFAELLARAEQPA